MTVGVEVSAGILRAVRLERFRPGEAPESIAEIAYTSTGPSGVPPAETIATLMRRVGAVDEAVAVAVPSSWCFYRDVSFPYRAARRVESTLTFALEGRLPGKIEGYVIEPLTDIHRAGAAGAQLLVAACPGERLKDLLAEFRSVGIEPCIIQPAIVSVSHMVAGPEEMLLVRLAGNELEVAFLREGEIASCEVIQCAIGQGELPAARTLADKVRSAIRAYEISHGRGVSFQRVVLLAPETIRAALSAELQSALELTAPPDSSLYSNGCSPAALGAAAEAAGRKHLAVNLRSGEFAYAPYERRMERRLVAALVLATAIAALLSVPLLGRTRNLQSDTTADSRNEAALYAEITGMHGVPNIERTKEKVEQTRKDINRNDRLRVVSCLSRWADLARLVPANVTLDTLDIGQDRMVIGGHAKDADSAFEFRAKVQASRAFQPDAPVVTRNPGSADTTFTMELRYR